MDRCTHFRSPHRYPVPARTPGLPRDGAQSHIPGLSAGDGAGRIALAGGITERQIPHGESRGLVQASLHQTSLSPARRYDTSECIGTHAWHLSVWRCGQRFNRRTGFEPVPLPSETAGYLWRGELYPRKRRGTRKGRDPWSLLLMPSSDRWIRATQHGHVGCSIRGRRRSGGSTRSP